MIKTNNSICYEAIQRIFRNAIVNHIRISFLREFKDDHLIKLKRPFKESEWSEIERNAKISRSSCELDAQIKDCFDILSVNHFFNIFDSYSKTLIGNIEDANSKRIKQNILNWLRIIKNMRDPLSHPSEEDFSFEDSFLLIDSSRRALLALNLIEPARLIKELMAELRGPSGAKNIEREPLEDRLPPRESICIDFVGRRSELERLREWMSDPASRRWALAGDGGKGKTALAYQFGLEIKFKSPEPFQAVIWLSAKKKRFVEGETISIFDPDFDNLDTALNKILFFFGWSEDIGKPIESKKDVVLELLNEFPSLVIVDDIDSLDSENEDAIEYFSTYVIRTRSKVLFTSRRTIFGMGGSTTTITGLDVKGTGDFIVSRCTLMEIDRVNFNDRTIRKIQEVTDGSPLYIEDLLRLTKVLSPENAIKAWESKGGNEARKYSLGRECDLLSDAAKSILFAACVCNGPISSVEIEAILNFSQEKLTSSLQELQKLFLVPKPKIIEGEERFELNNNLKLLISQVFGSTQAYKKVEHAYKVRSGEIKYGYKDDIAAIIRQAMFLLKSKRVEESEQLLKNALIKFPDHTDILGILGLTYKVWTPPRYTDSRANFARSAQLKCKKEEMYIHWCKMECDQAEWSKAAEAAEKGLKIIHDCKYLNYLAGYSRSRLAKEHFNILQNEKGLKNSEIAERHLENALRCREINKTKDDNINQDIFRALVITLETKKDIDGVKKYFKYWREDYPNDPNLSSEWDRISRKYRI